MTRNRTFFGVLATQWNNLKLAQFGFYIFILILIKKGCIDKCFTNKCILAWREVPEAFEGQLKVVKVYSKTGSRFFWPLTLAIQSSSRYRQTLSNTA